MSVQNSKSLVSQVIIFMDSVGTVRAEAPGLNGFRQKINLPPDFVERNPELIAALQTQQFHNNTWKREHDAAIKQREHENKLRQLAEDKKKIEDVQSRRAREIYIDIAKHHSPELANRVISDPKRRPRAKMIAIYDHAGNAHFVSPQNEKEYARIRGDIEATGTACKNAPRKPAQKFTAAELDI